MIMVRTNLLLYILLFVSCSNLAEFETNVPPIVIEGWIENDSVAKVSVYTNMDVKSTQTQVNFIDNAKITICDGEHYEDLLLYKDSLFHFGKIYKGAIIKGVVGKQYELAIEYENKVYRAETSLLEIVPLDSINDTYVSRTQYLLNGYITDNPDTEDYYMFLTRDTIHSVFYPAYLGVYSDKNLKQPLGLPFFASVSRAHNNYYYKTGEHAEVKLAHITKEGYEFWNQFMHSITLDGNMFFFSTKNLPSNIDGACGYWIGYSCSLPTKFPTVDLKSRTQKEGGSEW